MTDLFLRPIRLRFIGLQREEILKKLHPNVGEDRFGVELDAFDEEFAVAETHDDAIGFRGDFELIRKSFFLDDERVIARGGEILRQILEDGLVVMVDAAGFAVHDFRRSNHAPSKRKADGLMAETHTENWNHTGEAANHVHADTGVLRSAWTRRNYDALRLLLGNLLERDLVVAMHFQFLAQLAEELREVIGERIVVVEEKNHRPQPESVSCISHKQTAARRKTNKKV
jgi:hypothetical protein